MQQQDDLLGNINDFSFSGKLKEDLQKTALWAKISAVISLCGAMVMLLQNISTTANLIGTLIAEACNVSITICLLYFGVYTKRGIETTDQTAFEKGLNNLRLYFKTLGIIMTIVICLVVLVIILSLLLGVKPFYAR